MLNKRANTFAVDFKNTGSGIMKCAIHLQNLQYLYTTLGGAAIFYSLEHVTALSGHASIPRS